MAHHITKRALYRRRMRGSVPYADILALEPTVFVQLRYAELDGQQLLFQDPACTVPVETAGQDTIGGVKDLDANIVAVQDTAAHRPVWYGEAIGARFDTVYDLLLGVESVALGSQFFTAVAANVDLPASGNTHLFDGRGDGDSTIAYRAGANERDVFFRSSDGTVPTTQPSMSYVEKQAIYFADATASEVRTYKNNALEDSQSMMIDEINLTSWGIGGNPSGDNYLGGDVTEIALFSGGKTADERTTIFDALEAEAA